MKQFLAGVLVTTSLLLVGFQNQKPKPTYTYTVTEFYPGYQKFGATLMTPKILNSQLNLYSKRYGQLKQVVLIDNVLRDQHTAHFYWEKEN